MPSGLTIAPSFTNHLVKCGSPILVLIFRARTHVTSVIRVSAALPAIMFEGHYVRDRRVERINFLSEIGELFNEGIIGGSDGSYHALIRCACGS